MPTGSWRIVKRQCYQRRAANLSLASLESLISRSGTGLVRHATIVPRRWPSAVWWPRLRPLPALEAAAGVGLAAAAIAGVLAVSAAVRAAAVRAAVVVEPGVALPPLADCSAAGALAALAVLEILACGLWMKGRVRRPVRQLVW